MTPEELDLLENGLKSYQYRYKPGMGNDGGENTHLGPMAQGLASTEIGRGMVHQGEDGMLGIDGARAGVTSLGLVGDLHQRLKAIERGQQAQPQAPQAQPGIAQSWQPQTGNGFVSEEAQVQLDSMQDDADHKRKTAILAHEPDLKLAMANGIPPWRAWTQGARRTIAE